MVVALVGLFLLGARFLVVVAVAGAPDAPEAEDGLLPDLAGKKNSWIALISTVFFSIAYVPLEEREMPKISPGWPSRAFTTGAAVKRQFQNDE